MTRGVSRPGSARGDEAGAAAVDPAAARQPPRLALALDAAHSGRFLLLLQQGVLIRRRVGCPLAAFLREEIGAGQATIERIQSIFLDGRPVDDLGAAIVRDGSQLALSAAMPGLVGATLRRGGAYSSLRGGITHREAGDACTPGMGWVTVKLFNLIMAELGPHLLRQGVFVKAPDLHGLLAELPPEVWEGNEGITLDGKALERGALRDACWLQEADRVLLSVSPAGR